MKKLLQALGLFLAGLSFVTVADTTQPFTITGEADPERDACKRV